MEVLFALLADRYERRSVLITSNLPFSKWDSIFKDPMTTAAAIDRLVHHSTIVELNLPSYRLQAAQRASGREPPQALQIGPKRIKSGRRRSTAENHASRIAVGAFSRSGWYLNTPRLRREF